MEQCLLIFGASGHGAVVADAIECQGRFRVAGFIDSVREVGADVIGYQVLGGEDVLGAVMDRCQPAGIVLAIGDNWQRAKTAERLKSRFPTLSFPPTIHPSATVARTAEIAEGAVILAGATINSRASVGGFCLLNTNSSLDHDARMDDYSSLAPNSAVAGYTTVGAYTAICMGAAVLHKVTVGAHCVVGSGAVVLKDLPDAIVAYGCPARVVRSRSFSESYL